MRFVLPTTYARTRIYRPRKESVPIESFASVDVTEVVVIADDGLGLNGWYALSRADRDGPRPLILYFPGNAGHRGYRTAAIEMFGRLGCDLLIVDYRGYGDNSGQTTERNHARDASAAWRFVREELRVPAERIVVFGESIGGAVGIQLVSTSCRRGIEPAGLILQATFTSMLDVVSQFFPRLLAQVFLVDRYPSQRRIRHITCPILSIHGESDRLIPLDMGRRLFDAAPPRSSSGHPKQFLQLTGIDHGDILDEAGEQIEGAIGMFLADVVQAIGDNVVVPPRSGVVQPLP